uniref:Uncharacterized protein n=1 Tax=Rhizophora mucronata TaxID=61149 RepID=A0A2P2NR73_RHIMU
MAARNPGKGTTTYLRQQWKRSFSMIFFNMAHKHRGANLLKAIFNSF